MIGGVNHYQPMRGVFTALITPFTSTGAVDVARLKRLVDYQIEGVDGLVPCGTTNLPP